MGGGRCSSLAPERGGGDLYSLSLLLHTGLRLQVPSVRGSCALGTPMSYSFSKGGGGVVWCMLQPLGAPKPTLPFGNAGGAPKPGERSEGVPSREEQPPGSPQSPGFAAG